MSLRPTKAPPAAAAAPTVQLSDSSSDEDSKISVQPSQEQISAAQPQPSLSQRAVSQTLASTANLANLLPTGTLLAFQLLIPVFTNNGSCDEATRPLTVILLFLFALSCFVASFTDSFKASNGQLFYGIATTKGLFLFDYPTTDSGGPPLPDLSKYKLRFIDFVHALLSVFVFGAVAFRDKNVLGCLYPMPEHKTQEVLDIVPIGIGLISSLLFVIFPTTRHGIGYPISR